MRLSTQLVGGAPSACAELSDGSLLDIAAAAAMTNGADGGARDALSAGTLQAIIEGGSAALSDIGALIEQAEAGAFATARHQASAATPLAPIPQPRKNVFCVGRNYAEHIAESGRAQKTSIDVTSYPVFFTKPMTAVIGHGAAVPIFEHVSSAIDYEVELAVVIGKAGRDIPAEQAYEHVFGYTILNDITARDIQRQHGGQYFRGKGLDGSCPIGPAIITKDEIADPQSLSIGLSVNGEQRQSGNTAAMIFDIPTIIASLSKGITLEPGDIIATGTPSGVGYAMTPPRYLADGDVVVCEVEGIGRLENPIRTN